MLTLAGTRPRTSAAALQGRRDYLPLSEQLWTAAGECSRREGATFFMTLLAAYAVLLQRHPGHDDLLIGSPIAGRTQQDIEPLIGFLVNMLVLRLNLGGDPTFRQLMAQARQVALGAYANQDVPFERVVEALRPARTTGYLPLLQTVLTPHNSPTSVGDRRVAGDLTMKRRLMSTHTAKFDVMLAVRRSSAGPVAILETASNLFDEAGAMRLLRSFERIFEDAVAHPERRLSELGDPL